VSESFSVGDQATVFVCGYHSRYGLNDGMSKYLHTDVTIESVPVELFTQSRPQHLVRSALDGSTFYASVCCLCKCQPSPQREATSTWDDVIVWRPKTKESERV
jgi:hypothetical protein